MNPTAIYSKSGKGVQEASGKTSNLARGDRAVLSAFDGRLTVSDVAERVGKPFDAKFEQIITQLDRDGYIREVSSGASAAKPAPGKPAPAAAKPAAAPAKPAGAPGEDLDFTIAIPASPAPKPPPAKAATMAPAAAARAETEKKAQEDNMTRARREAEERQHKERDRIKAETEAKLRVETEAKMRSEAAQKAKADAEKAKKDAEEKIRADADAKVKAAREAAVKAAFEAERKAKEETDRIRKEAEDKARKEAAELQRKLDEERRAREEAERARQEAERKAREAADKARQEAERKAKEEADRIRKEAEEKARREAAELQRKLDEERRAREDAERRAREEAERAKKETERAAREQAEREQQEAERESRELAERLRREQEDSHAATVRAAQEAEQAARELIEAQEVHAKQQEKDKEAEAAKGKGGGGGFDSLLADLDSFSDREDEDRKAKEEADRKAKEEKARRQREEEEAKGREEGERKQREAAELERQLEEERKKEETTRKAREEQEARERREEEERKAEEKKRKRREEALAKEAKTEKSDDIGVSDDDLGMDDVKADEEQVSKESRKAARAREREAKEREQEAQARAREREREAKRAASGPAVAPVGGYKPIRRSRGSWGKPIALTLFVLLLAGVGYLHVMPVNTQDYEKAASDAIGVPVRIGTARLSVYKGVVLNLENISVGDMKIPAGRAYPEIGSLFDEKKVLTRLDLDGVTLPQEALGALLDVKLRNDRFYVARLNARQVKLPGPLPLPAVDTEITVGPQGSISVIELRGPDNLAAKLTPRGADIDFEATASGFTIPFLPDVTLSTFAMKGRATRDAARIESWGGAIVGGAVNGNANVRWAGGTWNLDGTMTLRGINAATFAPALLSDGNAEGTARFSMSDPDPSKFKQRGRVEGSFIMNRGVLGSFDLSRAILTGGRQATGRTPFIELNGQGVYDRGAVTLRNVTFAAGAMNATANAEISPEGALSGRIVADIKTSAQQLRATINVGGTVGEPQVK